MKVWTTLLAGKLPLIASPAIEDHTLGAGDHPRLQAINEDGARWIVLNKASDGENPSTCSTSSASTGTRRRTMHNILRRRTSKPHRGFVLRSEDYDSEGATLRGVRRVSASP